MRGTRRCERIRSGSRKWFGNVEKMQKENKPPKKTGGVKPKLFTGFGETKSLTEWTRDLRCQVERSTLQDRLERLGMSVEEAITKPSQRKLPDRPDLKGIISF